MPRQAESRRFGIGEWFGRSLVCLSVDDRRALANLATGPKSQYPPCPFQSNERLVMPCTKKGGICTLRLYAQAYDGEVTAVAGEDGRLRTVCPARFQEGGLIYRWVGREMLQFEDPIRVTEVDFLTPVATSPNSTPGAVRRGDVGRIDEVLVVPGSSPMQWCALEVQAVYFQGSSMAPDVHALRTQKSRGLPFPAGRRQPDYRSSGPKRLMPQLQVKVPSLRRWGKKMAVVVDRDFYAALAPMSRVDHVSNCDIAWFVVEYDESSTGAKLVPHEVHLTTLEQAVEGLTAGVPVSLDIFEKRIRSKLARLGWQ